MPQQHLDRLSSLDVSFLTNESATSHMHVGGILIFEGPPPSYDDLLYHVRSRLHLVPRFRQKLAHPPVQTGRPFWVDDTSFNLEYHVSHSALPARVSEELGGHREQGGEDEEVEKHDSDGPAQRGVQLEPALQEGSDRYRQLLGGQAGHRQDRQRRRAGRRRRCPARLASRSRHPHRG